MKAYYARPISIDNTPQFARDEALIRALGFEPAPTPAEKVVILERYKEIGMEAFRQSVEAADALVFRAFPDGSIGSGVAQEIAWAQAAGRPIIEIPRQVERRALSVDQTRAMLDVALRAAKSPVDSMVNRFLGWQLPKTFSPDCGISFKQLPEHFPWPVGTNLFSADEAKAMFEYALASTAKATPVEGGTEGEG